MTCEVCKCRADYVSPASLCNYHWHLWWYTEMFSETVALDDLNSEELEWYFIINRGESLKIIDTSDSKILMWSY